MRVEKPRIESNGNEKKCINTVSKKVERLPVYDNTINNEDNQQ